MLAKIYEIQAASDIFFLFIYLFFFGEGGGGGKMATFLDQFVVYGELGFMVFVCTVNSEIFAKILFSRVVLKDTFVK